jgi:hypothetical protein
MMTAKNKFKPMRTVIFKVKLKNKFLMDIALGAGLNNQNKQNL